MLTLWLADNLGGEEIDEMEEGSIEIGKRNGACSRPEKTSVDRPVDRRRDRLTRLSTGAQRARMYPGRSTESSLLSVGSSRPGRATVDEGRSTDNPFWLSFLDSDSFSVWDQIQSGFLNTLGLCGYK